MNAQFLASWPNGPGELVFTVVESDRIAADLIGLDNRCLLPHAAIVVALPASAYDLLRRTARNLVTSRPTSAPPSRVAEAGSGVSVWKVKLSIAKEGASQQGSE